MTGKQPDIRARIQTHLDEIRGRVLSVLPAEKAPDQFMAILAEYLTRNSDLYRCERHSLDDALIDCAMLGLEPGAPFELASILPFNVSEPNGPRHLVASLVIEYRGHMLQVYRTGRVKAIEARPVYAGDRFEYEFGRNPRLVHRPTNEDRGELVHAYAIARLMDGDPIFEVINRHDADQARADSPNARKKNSLWNRRPAAMWCKTVIKKLAARLPRTLATNAGSGPDPPPAEFLELINAVSTAPDLYKAALEELSIDVPADVSTIQAVLSSMRRLYIAHQSAKNQPH